MKRSMIRASARMELATNGQIGQPAACMMENKNEPHADGKPVDYGPRAESCGFGWLRQRLTQPFASPTEHVDNFVQKPAGNASEPALTRHWLGVMRKTAVKILMKSITCCVNAGDRRGRWRGVPCAVEMWSSRATAARVPCREMRAWAGAARVAGGPSVAWRSERYAVSGEPMAMGRRRLQLQESSP
jgi:hypothetical protein